MDLQGRLKREYLRGLLDLRAERDLEALVRHGDDHVAGDDVVAASAPCRTRVVSLQLRWGFSVGVAAVGRVTHLRVPCRLSRVESKLISTCAVGESSVILLTPPLLHPH